MSEGVVFPPARSRVERLIAAHSRGRSARVMALSVSSEEKMPAQLKMSRAGEEVKRVEVLTGLGKGREAPVQTRLPASLTC